jgi:hypothetical protein
MPVIVYWDFLDSLGVCIYERGMIRRRHKKWTRFLADWAMHELVIPIFHRLFPVVAAHDIDGNQRA